MYELRRIFDDPYAVDGPLIIRTDDLAEAHEAGDQAIHDWRLRKILDGTTTDGEKFVLVLLNWKTLRPGEVQQDEQPTSVFSREWQVPG